ncbi:MAG: hypothetical protein OEY06_11700 [Gammaproteobacteria bacterium]|nr:hypothetical protein [Gammaproteobacteria bacterium]
MDKLKYLIPVIAVLLNSGCASFGPTVRIETPEPAEDFLLLCDWAHSPWFKIHGGRSIYNRVPIVAKSGEDTPCGMSPFGGHPSVSVMHPIYLNPTITEEEDVTIYHYTETKLDYLDKQKEKFEAGFWDKHRNPGARYSDNLVNCSFGHQYFDYYSEVKNVDKEHFKRLYHESMLECFKRKFSIIKKYDPQIGGQLPTADEWMRKIWESDQWSEY